MRVTIIPEDKIVVIDGIAAQFDFEIDPNIRAVQWDDSNTRGNKIEQHKGGALYLDSLSDYQDIIDGHAEFLRAEEEAHALQMAQPPEPTDLEIRLAALEAKASITDNDLAQARQTLMERNQNASTR